MLTQKHESGATLVIVAASLLFIMGFAALVIDGGLGFSERRQAQSAVDFGVLAALSAATSCAEDSSCPIDLAKENGATEAKSVVAGNLPGRTLDWDGCTDPAPPPDFIAVDSTDCISFTENNDKARVALPEDALETLFGRVIGASILTIRADAEAEQKVESSASILPLSPKGSGPEICLFTNQDPQAVPPCDGPESGHFGYIDLALFGNEEMGTPSTCSQGNQNLKIALNISLGSDHILTTYTGSDPVVNDHDACPNRSEDINELVIESGSSTNTPTTEGLYSGVSGNIVGHSVSGDPRLRCTTGTCAEIRGRDLDHLGLWEYLVPGACPSANDHESMSDCLDDWGGGVIFEDDLASNLRFGAVPDLSPTANPLRWRIDSFVPVWLETIFMGCDANHCTTIHSPGEPDTGTCPDPGESDMYSCGWDSSGHGNSVEGITAFSLELGMLPPSIADFFPGQGNLRTTALIR